MTPAPREGLEGRPTGELCIQWRSPDDGALRAVKVAA